MQWVTLLRACLIVGGRSQLGEVGFKDKKRKRGTNVLNKTAEKVLKKLGTKEETRDKVAVTTVSKLSLDQDHKKQSFGMPEMAKKKTFTQSAKQRSARLEFVKKNRSLTVDKKGAGMINFSLINAQNIFYTCLI